MLLVAMNQGAGPRSPTVARLHLKVWGSMLLGLQQTVHLDLECDVVMHVLPDMHLVLECDHKLYTRQCVNCLLVTTCFHLDFHLEHEQIVL